MKNKREEERKKEKKTPDKTPQRFRLPMFMFHRQADGPHEAHVQLPFNPLPLSLHEIIICAKLHPRPYLFID